MSLTKTSYSMINNAPVNLIDFIPAGTDTSTTDCRQYIQNALNSRSGYVTIVGGGLTYKIGGAIYIRGNNKTLDFQGGQLILDVSTTNNQAVVFDNPTVTQTQYCSLKNVTIDATASTQAQTDIIGIAMSGGMINPSVENVVVYHMNTGLAIYGGPVGGNDTPYYGLFTNFKVSFCDTGVAVTANSAYPNITTHNFINLVSSGNTGVGVYFYNALCCSLINPSIEGNGGANLHIELSGNIYVFGGLNEGGNPNVKYVNNQVNFGNIILGNMYPSVGDTGTTLATYWQNPSVAFQSNVIQLNRIGSTQLNFPADQVLELKSNGTLCVYGADGRYARFLLANDDVELIETGSAVGSTDWSTTKDTAGKVNVYFDAGAYQMQNKNGANFFKLYFQEGF